MPADPQPTAVEARARTRVRECRDCGLFQQIPPPAAGTTARCVRCAAVLRRVPTKTLALPLTCAASAAVLFVIALQLPFMDMRVLGRFSRAMVLTGPEMLADNGAALLSVAVIATLLVLPATKLACLLAVLGGLKLPRPPRVLPWLFAVALRLGPWAMIEVFLLGVIVAYSRLNGWAPTDPGPALLALGGVMMAAVGADASLDRDAVWEALEDRGLLWPAFRPSLAARFRRGVAVPNRGPAHWMGCEGCGLVARATEGARCARCAHELRHRKRNGIVRTWALVATATIFYIPANVLPVMTVQRMGQGSPSTILGGVVELAQAQLWPLAILVFVASFTVPMLKLASLATMLVLSRRRSSRWLRGRTRLFRFVLVIGRWSMIDVFALTTLVGVVRMGFLATVMPGDGATAFCGVVLVTMLATELFDARVMWDAAGAPSGAEALDGLCPESPEPA